MYAVIKDNKMAVRLETVFAGSRTLFMISGALAASENNYAFEVAFHWSYEIQGLIDAIREFMNKASEAMDSAAADVADAANSVEDAKASTCQAIGKKCDEIKTCDLRYGCAILVVFLLEFVCAVLRMVSTSKSHSFSIVCAAVFWEVFGGTLFVMSLY